jgi:serine/threonine-protein kinase ULK4
MSPELFVKDGVHSYQSDLWSLGCVLYELSTGRAPFEAAALPDLMRKISFTEPDFDQSVLLATEADPVPSVTI